MCNTSNALLRFFFLSITLEGPRGVMESMPGSWLSLPPRAGDSEDLAVGGEDGTSLVTG